MSLGLWGMFSTNLAQPLPNGSSLVSFTASFKTQNLHSDFQLFLRG